MKTFIITSVSALALSVLPACAQTTPSKGDQVDTRSSTLEEGVESEYIYDYAIGGPYYASEADAAADAELEPSVIEIAMTDPRFSTFVSLIEEAGLTEELIESEPFTLFAPTNEAFRTLDPAMLDSLKLGSDPDLRDHILRAHMVPGVIFAADVPTTATPLITVDGSLITIRRDDAEGIIVGSAIVQFPDITASNGIMHGIDHVILPDD